MPHSLKILIISLSDARGLRRDHGQGGKDRRRPPKSQPHLRGLDVDMKAPKQNYKTTLECGG